MHAEIVDYSKTYEIRNTVYSYYKNTVSKLKKVGTVNFGQTQMVP